MSIGDCKRCKSKFAILVPLYDDGHKREYCRECKRKIRAENPNKDFRKWKGAKQNGDNL